MSVTDARDMSRPASAPAPVAGEAAAAPRVGVILAAVASVLLLASLGQTIVSTALPTIVGELDGLEHISWVITAYLLASTVGAPVYGKLGDLFGRKIVLQGGILVFLAGSLVCALAGSMAAIVAGRVIQGLGGGGLIVVSMAVVGDVLPARDRGKAQGILGSVFGVSTVIGPLIGGFIVENFGWHWVFLVNLPVGLLALGVLAVALKPPAGRPRPRVDYAGAGLLALVLSAAVLLSNLGGTSYPWGSAPILGLAALLLLGLAALVAVEARAAEPILPLGLFRINNFLVVNGVGLLVGTAMFGTVTFMPLYLQVVQGVSPTASGLFLLPMMLGLIGSSFLAGREMSRTGRYKRLPTLSTAVLLVGMLLLSTLTGATPLWQVALFMLAVGLGIGPVMSVGVAAIQNAVPVRHLGIGTASANMFRLIGGSLGTSAFGAMFARGITAGLPEGLAEGEAGGFASLDRAALEQLPEAVRGGVLLAFTEALQPVFLVAAGLALLACLVSTLLRELPLATTLRRA